MHIGFRTSGGRGEYEVVGSLSAYTASSLEGWTFDIAWPDGLVRPTFLELEPATSGKPRLRSTARQHFQIGRMIAAMLLLPDPCRDLRSAGDGVPVAISKRYLLSRVGFGADTEFSGFNDIVTVSPSFVDIRNRDETDSVGVQHRWERIARVYEEADRLDSKLSRAVREHQRFMASGEGVDQRLVRIVKVIRTAVESTVGVAAAEGDPLPVLETLCGIAGSTEPSLPPPDQLGEEDDAASVRSAHQYRLAKIRGANGRRFSAAVRRAYSHRCLVCGGRFSGIDELQTGIDAAHILAWSRYDLDVVSNGIALCKLHHWAFDAALLMPFHDGGSYRIRLTKLSQSIDAKSLSLIATDNCPIPDDRLPSRIDERPNEHYLERLYADLAVDFLT
jgi:hypothetical protein